MVPLADGLYAVLLFRFVAVTVFLQGVGPLLLFGMWRRGGLFLFTIACIYLLLAVGLWRRRRWALPLALAVTLPQLLIISSWLFSWRFFVGMGFGTGVAYAPRILDMPTFSYHSYIGALNFGFFGYNPVLLAEFGNEFPHGFVCINGLAALVLGLLAALLIIQRRLTRRHTLDASLQSTVEADDVSIELDPRSYPGSDKLGLINAKVEGPSTRLGSLRMTEF